jgi:hypothetical protein
MVLHAHLALQRREHGLDHETDAGLGDLGGWALTEPVLAGSDQLHANELEAVMVLATSVAGIGTAVEPMASGGGGEVLRWPAAGVTIQCVALR